MAKTVQTTFTKQKRQLAKANALIGTIRAQETRTQRFDADAKLETEERTAYIVDAPENIASQVVEIIADVVRQHGARQRANSVSKGRFEFCGIEADLTVPQLRALQEAQTTLAALVDKLPVENKRRIPNGELDGRPAFFSPLQKIFETKTRNVPYEETASTRVRTYEEKYDVLLYQTRTVEIDYGLPTATIARLKTLVEDLATAIQVAIDEANAQARDDDAFLNDVAVKILAEFERQWKPEQ